jgi:hypothetical protein
MRHRGAEPDRLGDLLRGVRTQDVEGGQTGVTAVLGVRPQTQRTVVSRECIDDLLMLFHRQCHVCGSRMNQPVGPGQQPELLGLLPVERELEEPQGGTCR